MWCAKTCVQIPFSIYATNMTVYVDATFAGCRSTRRSTSGGGIMFGSHCIKHWSSTQTTSSLASAEAELHGIAKGAAQALGMRSIGKDMGAEIPSLLLTDASAALGIVRRRGLGRIRRLDVTDLWIQEQVRSKEMDIQKVAGADNIADALTKHVSSRPREALETHEPLSRRGTGRNSS